MSRKNMYTIDSKKFEEQILKRAKELYPWEYAELRNERVKIIRTFLNSIWLEYIIFKRARYKWKISIENLKSIIDWWVENNFVIYKNPSI